MIIIQQVLLRKRKQLKYCWLQCANHLSHCDIVIFEGGAEWLVVEIFILKKLSSEAELKFFKKKVKVLLVISGGSYEILELNDKGRPRKNR